VSIQLSRDCNAVQIPHGQSLLLPSGTPVDITQTLGGSFTVRAGGALFRIASEDADALGMSRPTAPAEAASVPAEGITEERVWETLKTCFDPEIPVNIVDLGLVYDMRLHKLPSGQNRVDV